MHAYKRIKRSIHEQYLNTRFVDGIPNNNYYNIIKYDNLDDIRDL